MDSISECFQQGPMQEIFDSLILLLDIQIFPLAVLPYKTMSICNPRPYIQQVKGKWSKNMFV